jgi:magnesium-transporting ATPase (P-type)
MPAIHLARGHDGINSLTATMAMLDQGLTRPPDPNGLSSRDAAERLGRAGPNRLKPPRQRAVALQLLLQFKNPLVLVLLVTSGISAITGDACGALIIGLTVLMSVTLDFVQSYRAGQAADRLALQVAVAFFGLLVVLVACYLFVVEKGKQWFYRHQTEA